jgi:hypothetical protein
LKDNSVLTRRGFIEGSFSTGILGAVSGCDSGPSSYQQAVRKLWAPEAAAGSPDIHRVLIAHSVLAASSHNTQPWKFRPEASGITILPDLSRRCPVVDPDDHHLFVSLGCACENLTISARAVGLDPTVEFEPAGNGAVRVTLQPKAADRSPLFEALHSRQSSRTEYDGKPVSGPQLHALEQSGSEPGVRMILLTSAADRERVLEYVIEGNRAQLGNTRFVHELEQWIRFSESDAVRRGDGLFTASTGNPTLPPWLGRQLFRVFLSPGSENDKYRRQIRSSSGIAVWVSDVDDKAHWIAAGRACERFCLQAAALGIRTAFINQPVEVAAIRAQFASFIGITHGRPDLIVRFGYGPAMPRSLRRPLEDVIIS